MRFWHAGTNSRVFVGGLAIMGLLLGACSQQAACTGGSTSATFRVAEIGVEPGAYFVPSSPFQVTVRILFNRVVDTSTLTAPGDSSGSVDVTLVGTSDNRRAENIAGTFQFPPDPAAQIETTFESIETLGDLIDPGPGENIEYRIGLNGDDILDSSGNQLDADGDGTAGGSCTEVFEVIG